MNAPEPLIAFYQFLSTVQGWIIFIIIPIAGILIAIRGFNVWQKTQDLEAVFKALQSIFSLLLVLVFILSLTSMYDWLRLTPLGKNLPDISADIQRAKSLK